MWWFGCWVMPLDLGADGVYGWHAHSKLGSEMHGLGEGLGASPEVEGML